jgi:hypothetical protein
MHAISQRHLFVSVCPGAGPTHDGRSLVLMKRERERHGTNKRDTDNRK